MTHEQFLEFARVLPEPLLLIAGTGHILAVNPPLTRMLAMRSDEICGRQLTDLVTTPAEKVMAYLAACARSRAMLPGALTFQTRDGQPVVCRCEGAVVRPWSMDAPALILMRSKAKESASSKFLLLNQKIDELSREIRVRRRAEAEAYRQREQLRFLSEITTTLASSLDYETTLLNVVRLVVPFLADWCVVDVVATDGTLQRLAVAHVDPTKEQWADELIRRYPPDPNAPYSVSQVIHSGKPAVLPQISEEWLVAVARDAEHLQLLRNLGLTSMMIIPLRARGQTLGALTLIAEKSGRHYGAPDVALAEEVAQRVVQAIDNSRLYQEAQAAVRLRDTFISIAAHELRTPLTSLMGNVQLLARRAAREGMLAERDRRPLQVISTQAARLNRMIHALLDISRIETGQLRIEPGSVDLCALVRQVVDELHPTLDKHTVECRTPNETLIVAGDTLRLEQVVQNLLQNAIKYSPAGGSVVIHIERRGEQACVSVRDQGMGIPAQEVPRLFERFYRASNADTQYLSGMGIGLYVVKEIVTLHGGTVEVESIEGTGSCFTICLPLTGQP